MSTILDLIDGTLTDCTVSPDAMRWTSEPEPEFVRWDVPVSVRMLECAETFATAMRQMTMAGSITVSVDNLKAALLRLGSLTAPAPSALDARYHQRQRNRAKRRRR